MKVIGAYEAKSHLSSLLDDVEKGEEIEITRRGKTVARLVPVPDREDARRAAEELLRRQDDLTLGELTIGEMVRYGRRF